MHVLEKGLTEAEILSFLRERGIKPLEGFTPHRPLIYVFEDGLRGRDSPFKNLPFMPSLARVDNPTTLRCIPGAERHGYTTHHLYSSGTVDYYTIDPQSKRRILVKKSNKVGALYLVRVSALFAPDNTLFPKSH